MYTVHIYWVGEAKQQSCTCCDINGHKNARRVCLFKLNSLSLNQHTNKQRTQRKKATEEEEQEKVAKDKYLKQKYQQTAQRMMMKYLYDWTVDGRDQWAES